MDLVLTSPHRFPEGTSVSAYPASNWQGRHAEGAPVGTATDTQIVSGGSVAFTGLTADVLYYAVAQVGSDYRYLSFTPGADQAEQHGASLADVEERALVGDAYASRVLADNTEYTPSATRPTLVVVAPRIDCDAGETGEIAMQVGDAGAPSTVGTMRLRASALLGGGIDAQEISSFIVPAGKVYKLVQTAAAGAPAFTLGSAQELSL